MSFSLAALADLELHDDLAVAPDPTDYADQQAPMPPLPGIYRFRVEKAAPRTNKEGQLVLADDRFPTITIQSAKIVEPTEYEKGVGLLQDFRTKPGIRKTPNGDKPFSEWNDLLRAFDAREPLGWPTTKERFEQHVANGDTFLARLEWEGEDRDYREAEFEKSGGKDNLSKEARNAVYAKARRRTKDFLKGGVYQPTCLGPTGNIIEARPVLRPMPSHRWDPAKGEWVETTANLGPAKK